MIMFFFMIVAKAFGLGDMKKQKMQIQSGMSTMVETRKLSKVFIAHLVKYFQKKKFEILVRLDSY